MLDVVDILNLFGFDASLPTKLVRHQDSRYPIEEFSRSGLLELYQSYQGRPLFHNAKQIVSFYGLSGNRACFYGVYQVLGHRPASEGPVVGAFPPADWRRADHYFYDLERDKRFEELRDRLIIDWGKGARSWVQKLSSKPVLEVRAPGRRLSPFEDYLEFSLTYLQLKDLIQREDAHPDWRSSLSAVDGVYLILAESSGDLYVGSACGEEGIWGRWREYAGSGDGGNARLRELIAREPAVYPDGFRFSVLQILPKTMTKEEVIHREAKYKEKLGSRATGLNAN